MVMVTAILDDGDAGPPPFARHVGGERVRPRRLTKVAAASQVLRRAAAEATGRENADGSYSRRASDESAGQTTVRRRAARVARGTSTAGRVFRSPRIVDVRTRRLIRAATHGCRELREPASLGLQVTASRRGSPRRAAAAMPSEGHNGSALSPDGVAVSFARARRAPDGGNGERRGSDVASSAHESTGGLQSDNVLWSAIASAVPEEERVERTLPRSPQSTTENDQFSVSKMTM